MTSLIGHEIVAFCGVARLAQEAADRDALLVTTEKDRVRLTPPQAEAVWRRR